MKPNTKPADTVLAETVPRDESAANRRTGRTGRYGWWGALRPRRVLRWSWRHPKTALLLVLALGFGLLNAMAFMHAWRMTHFVQTSQQTGSIESLRRWEKLNVLVTGVRMPRPQNDSTPESLGLTYETRRVTLEGLSEDVATVAHSGPPSGVVPKSDVAPAADSTQASDAAPQLEGWYLPCAGATDLVVMLHGYGSSKSHLLPQAALWHRLGCQVWMIDFRGSGGSTGSTTTLGYREAEDVRGAVRYARRNFPCERLIIHGHSMGSVAALRCTAQGWIAPDAMILEAPFDRLLTTVEHRFESMGLPGFPSARLLVFWGGVQHGYWGGDHNPVDYAATVQCPVLILLGENDLRVRPEDARRVCDALAGPAELELFADMGHASCLNREPLRAIERIATFFQEQAGMPFPPNTDR
jgi:hypothetical protein